MWGGWGSVPGQDKVARRLSGARAQWARVGRRQQGKLGIVKCKVIPRGHERCPEDTLGGPRD